MDTDTWIAVDPWLNIVQLLLYAMGIGARRADDPIGHCSLSLSNVPRNTTEVIRKCFQAEVSSLNTYGLHDALMPTNYTFHDLIVRVFQSPQYPY
jgi:hypothetical protein